MERCQTRAVIGSLLGVVIALACVLRFWQLEKGPLPEVCSADQDYLRIIADGGIMQADSWQRAIQDKLIGASFARSLGVNAAPIHFFGRLGDLPDKWPSSWGRHLVFKPVSAFSSRGACPRDSNPRAAAEPAPWRLRLLTEDRTS